MNTILLRSPKIVILRILDKCREILDDWENFGNNNSSMSRIKVLVVYHKELIMHKYMSPDSVRLWLGKWLPELYEYWITKQ